MFRPPAPSRAAVCAFGWVAYLQYISSLTRAYGKALGVDVLLVSGLPGNKSKSD